MKYRTFNLVADVIDNSISPALIKGDTVAVRPGFKAENGHMVAILVTYEKEQTTTLYIRKVIIEDNHVIFKAANRDYPSFVYGEDNNNIRVVGIVTKLYRYSRNTPYPNFIVTAKPAKRKNETEVMK